MRGQTTHVLLLAYYTACTVTHAHIVCVLLASILQNISSDLHTSVKFKLSCTIQKFLLRVSTAM